MILLIWRLTLRDPPVFPVGGIQCKVSQNEGKTEKPQNAPLTSESRYTHCVALLYLI